MVQGVCRAVILCGGQGTRLRPLTYEIPKSLIPVHGRPVVSYIIDLLASHGVKDIVLSVGYLKESIKDFFKGGDIRVSFVEENEPLGTAGPLRLVDGLVEQHRKTKAMVTIALTRVDDPSAYGVARMDGLRIAEFVEKPARGQAPSNLINSGFYVMEPEVLNLIPPGFSMLEKDVFPRVAAMGHLYGFAFSGQWFDTGTFERYERAIKEWKGLKHGKQK